MQRHFGWAAVMAVACALAACGGDEGSDGGSRDGGSGGGAAADGGGGGSGQSGGRDAAPTDPAAAMQQAMEQSERAIRDANDGKDVKAVEPDSLAKVLPETFGSHARKNVEKQRQDMMGMSVSFVECDYEAPEAEQGGDTPPPTYSVRIQDIGSLKGPAAMGITMWSMQTFERTTDTGYEKTTKIGAWPALEEWDRESKAGSVKVIVAKRFIVEASGNDARVEDVRRLAETVASSRLADMAQ